MKNETDLRVIKTRENIRQSFLSLLKEKDTDKISVKEICTRAGCSRNTFYFHYPYRDALYQEIIDDCITSIKDGFRPTIRHIDEIDETSIYTFVEGIVNAMINEKETILALTSCKKSNDLYRQLIDIIFDCMLQNGRNISDFSDNEMYRLYCRYQAGGIVSYFLYYLEHQTVDEKKVKELFHLFYGETIQFIVSHLKGES